jgi:hypothetical protein
MLTQILPLIAGLGTAITVLFIAINPERKMKGSWRFPALLCLAFAGWSIWAILNEGPTGFWPEHTRNLWGVQIWFDLLLAASVGFAAIARPAARLGMQPLVWALFILSSGSIGLLAMFSRYLYLAERAETDLI